ncbi:MAG: hypothetical protein MUO40_10005, partial [Anaerolineaceae bacterium]|nr:hypothetical protein [Anaerolineaceae bacterium]
MNIDIYKLNQLLDKASYKTDGDNYERNHGIFLSENFPNCERFWKFFVIPLTKRIAGYPTNLLKNIRLREAMDPDLEDISITHYSIFLHLIYAHNHTELPIDSSIEEFYIHLASVYDLTDTFLEKIYFLLLKCRGGKSKLFNFLSRDDFIGMASNWYEENYSTVYNHYLSKGKYASMKLPNRKSLLKEFVYDFLSQKKLWMEYSQHSLMIRTFRNVLVHDVQI